MARKTTIAACCLGALVSVQAAAQQPARPAAPNAAAPGIDAGSIRRRAAQVAEFKALLADPDPTVRLLTMQDAIAQGDPSQRQMAIEAGLASNESTLLDAALRAVIADTATIVIALGEKDGKPSVAASFTSLKLIVTKFDLASGRLSGPGQCGDNGEWIGQFQGTTFSFSSPAGVCRGVLIWSAEKGDFEGRVNNDNGRASGDHDGVWRPR